MSNYLKLKQDKNDLSPKAKDNIYTFQLSELGGNNQEVLKGNITTIPAISATSITPNINNAFSLGEAGKIWQNLYVNRIFNQEEQLLFFKSIAGIDATKLNDNLVVQSKEGSIVISIINNAINLEASASAVAISTSNFNKILGITEDTVQKAFDRLDDFAVDVEGDIMTGALAIDGSADVTQFNVQGNATQTSLLVTFQDSVGNNQTTIGVDGALVVNEQGNSVDARIEGNTDQNLLFTDGSADSVGIGTATPNSKLQIVGSLSLPYVAKTADYVLTANDYTVDCDGTFDITLPTAVGITGRVYIIKNSGVGTITLDTTSSQTIDGLTSQSIATTTVMRVQSTNSNWIII